MPATQTPPAARAHSAATRPSPSPPAALFPISALRPGDVLLSCGQEALSHLIRRLDGGDYSHAAVYDGTFAVDATRKGFKRHELKDDMAEQWYIDAYRWHSPPPDPNDLGSGQYPPKPVIARNDLIVDAKTRFAYDELVMAAVVIALSEEPDDKWLRRSVRLLLSRVATWMHDHVFSVPGRSTMTCSESVTRSFDEAQPPSKYEIEIELNPLRDYSALTMQAVGVQAARPLSPYEETRQRYAELIVRAMQPNENSGLQQFALQFRADTSPGTGGAKNLPPGFVTPHDLQTSPSLRKLGRLSQNPTPPAATQSNFRLFLAMIWEFLHPAKSISRR